MDKYEKVDTWHALMPLIFDEARFHRLAFEDATAQGLEAPDLRKLYEAGTWPLPSDRIDFEERNAVERRKLLLYLRRSLGLSLLIGIVALGLVAAAGHAGPTMQPAPAKVLAWLGTVWMAWPTIFILGRISQTFGGQSLIERMPSVLFLLLYVRKRLANTP
jgi:hypothetical protein